MNSVQVVKVGKMNYPESLKIQRRLLKLRQSDQIDDIFLLLEHPPVLTLGKRGKNSNILASRNILKAEGIDIHEIGRGGDVTYHGPGQIVGYPIMNLKNHGKDVHKFVFNIEEIFIQLLKNKYNINAGRDSNHTGVWIEDEKITAIGLSIKRWVSMHGFAFNVNTLMEHFNLINPCGITDKGVTSLKQLSGHSLSMNKVQRQVIDYFSKIFEVKIEIIDKEVLFNLVGGDFDEKKET